MDQDRTLIDDPLFLACTRPAMVAGVTLEAMALNGMVTMMVLWCRVHSGRCWWAL